MLKRKMIVFSLVTLMLISVGFSGVVGAMGYNSERPAQRGQGLEVALEQGLITEAEYNELVVNREERQQKNKDARVEYKRGVGQFQSRTRMFERGSSRGLMQPELCHGYSTRGGFRNRR